MRPTPQQVQALQDVLRRYIDSTGFGSWVSDDKLAAVALEGAAVVVNNQHSEKDKR